MTVYAEDSHWPDPILRKASDFKFIRADCKNALRVDDCQICVSTGFNTSCCTQLCL